MVHGILPLVQREFSGLRAFNYVAEISQHHRIQSSPGYRDAARYCLDVWQKNGVSSQVVSYPSSYADSYWTQRMWEEWDCSRATLSLVQPHRQLLADYSIDKMSVIQRSISTMAGGVEAPLILLDKGEDESAYEGIDFTGAIVFSNYDWNAIRRWAVEKRGAIGIVSDRMMEFPPVRHRYDIPDAMLYTSFWWTGAEKQCFGFVLSTKAGDQLRKVCQKQWELHLADASQPAYPCVKADVAAKHYPGAIENVEAFIPGETDEEILLTAHLCHPQASANDNASGSATLLEAANVLQKLIADGSLPKPKRGIRFLLIPEMTGTYAWLACNEQKIPHVLAGLNLDMVGENQELCDSALTVVYPPHASHSFVGDLASAVLDEVAKEVSSFSGDGKYGLFRYATTTFTGGSDHYILTDPTVNIPTPMLIQWPDKFYHTSADTIEKVDPRSLYRVGCLSASYAWVMANLDGSSQSYVLSLSREKYLQEIGTVLTNAAADLASTPEADKKAAAAQTWGKVQHLASVRAGQIKSYERFVSADEQQLFAVTYQRQVELLYSLTEALWQEHMQQIGVGEISYAKTEEEHDPKYLRVPQRLFRGPWSNRGWIEQLPASEQDAAYAATRRGGIDYNLLVYWIDGKRNLVELNHLLELEAGQSNLPRVSDYLDLLAKLELIAWV